MKIVKRLLKIVFALIGLLVLIGIMALWIDSSGTNYLEINKNETASNNSYLIKKVNVIPMNQDTVLVDKMVYIKRGLLKRLQTLLSSKGLKLLMQGTNI